MIARRNDLSKEALSRLPELDIGELRQQWRGVYKAEAPPRLSRGLLVRAVAYRMQEVSLGGLRPEPQRRLRQIAIDLKQTGAARKRVRRELKPGTRLGEAGGSHISVVTMGANLTTVDGHIAAIKRWRDVYNSVR
jgi:DUF2924 family protein